jgi:hypothetical protein
MSIAGELSAILGQVDDIERKPCASRAQRASSRSVAGRLCRANGRLRKEIAKAARAKIAEDTATFDALPAEHLVYVEAIAMVAGVSTRVVHNWAARGILPVADKHKFRGAGNPRNLFRVADVRRVLADRQD